MLSLIKSSLKNRPNYPVCESGRLFLSFSSAHLRVSGPIFPSCLQWWVRINIQDQRAKILAILLEWKYGFRYPNNNRRKGLEPIVVKYIFIRHSEMWRDVGETAGSWSNQGAQPPISLNFALCQLKSNFTDRGNYAVSPKVRF